MKRYFLLLFCWLTIIVAFAQQTNGLIALGFYNVENLFDTIPNSGYDKNFSPKGSKQWNSERYFHKLDQLSKVIDQMGNSENKQGCAVIGLSEIESRQVLQDLINRPTLKNKRTYKMIHVSAKDRRGMEVALIYQPRLFKLEKYSSLRIHSKELPRLSTRDLLLVQGKLNSVRCYILVAHFPSRLGTDGGPSKSRNAVARWTKNIMDSLRIADPSAKVILMGDLNEDPYEPVCKELLGGKNKENKTSIHEWHNPYWQLYTDGYGTLVYKHKWQLFDQMIVSGNLLKNHSENLYLKKATIFKPDFILYEKGQLRGYPKRSFSGNRYIGGYSDHLPIVLFLEQK